MSGALLTVALALDREIFTTIRDTPHLHWAGLLICRENQPIEAGRNLAQRKVGD